VVTTSFAHGSAAEAVVLQPNGRILVGGTAFPKPDGKPEANFALVRYRQGGRRDKSFSGNGKVSTSLRQGYDPRGSTSMYALAIQPGGGILAAGGGASGATVVRYRPRGARDRSFGDGGKSAIGMVQPGVSRAQSLVLQPDGRGVMGGFYEPIVPGPSHLAAGRFTSDGSPDPSFGGDGSVFTQFGPTFDSSNYVSTAEAILVMPDGDIVAAGTAGDGTTQGGGFGLAGYRPDGSPNPEFSGDGKETTVFEGGRAVAKAAILQPDGKILVAGGFGDPFRGGFALARYHANGALDQSFSGDGKLITYIGDGADATAVMIQPDGKIVLTGSAHNATTGQTNFALARYNPDGSLDSTFSDDGALIASLGNARYFASGAVLQPDGKVVVAGTERTAPGTGRFILARFR
jgi:uncharacterized delta-60 repeat protein